MPISHSKKEEIRNLLCEALDKKLEGYSRETTFMPFLVKLMQDADRVATYSFVHSLTTTLGMSIYEKMSQIIVRDSVVESKVKHKIDGTISDNQRNVINKIIEELISKEAPRSPDAAAEMREVMEASTDGASPQKTGVEVDFYYLGTDGIKRYFEIKTPKPNIGVFIDSKRKMLEWVARKREKDMRVFLAFPYNPYHPKPYSRFTQQNLFQPGGDLLVGSEYWDLLSGGVETLENIFAIFDEVGKEYKEKINEKIKSISRGGHGLS